MTKNHKFNRLIKERFATLQNLEHILAGSTYNLREKKNYFILTHLSEFQKRNSHPLVKTGTLT